MDKGFEQFIEKLRALDFYTPLRSKGFMTSGDTCDACDIIHGKIESLINSHLKSTCMPKKELLQQAMKIILGELVDTELAKDIDQQLRHVLSDIDPFWIRWRYAGETQGWLERY